MKTIELDGKKIINLSTFFDEIDFKLTNNLNWETGKNFDAFIDILQGGFGVHEFNEKVRIIWKDSQKCRITLGFNETVIYY